MFDSPTRNRRMEGYCLEWVQGSFEYDRKLTVVGLYKVLLGSLNRITLPCSPLPRGPSLTDGAEREDSSDMDDLSYE